MIRPSCFTARGHPQNGGRGLPTSKRSSFGATAGYSRTISAGSDANGSSNTRTLSIMATGSNPGTYTGLAREDQANNGTAPAFSLGLVDVWRESQQQLGGTITLNDDDSWQQRV